MAIVGHTLWGEAGYYRSAAHRSESRCVHHPGLYVGVVTDRPVEFHPALYLGWDRLLVGVETVVTLDAWRVDTAGEAAAVAAVGVGVCLVGLHLLNWLARANGWLAEQLLDGTYGPLAAVRPRAVDAE